MFYLIICFVDSVLNYTGMSFFFIASWELICEKQTTGWLISILLYSLHFPNLLKVSMTQNSFLYKYLAYHMYKPILIEEKFQKT